MIDQKNISALRMKRQFLSRKAKQTEYDALYRDMQPGQSVYFHGFGAPPQLTFRVDFNDIEYNRIRQQDRILLKGRFQGGNIGWIIEDDLELFAGLYRKPLDKPTPAQNELLELIYREGPMNIQQMKEETGMLVKQITPVLHRLQEAFLIYEDQYDGEWDRGWYKFTEMFPDADLNRYTRHEALEIVLQRFAYRHVHFNVKMAKSFYKLPVKDIKLVISKLEAENILTEYANGYILTSDYALLKEDQFEVADSIYIMHRNDFFVKSKEYWLKEKYSDGTNDILQYILINGEFHGAVLGKFKYGPYIIENIVVDLEGMDNEILKAVCSENKGSNPERFNGEII